MNHKEWDSRSTLEAHLKEQNRPSLIVGSDAEAPRKFYSVDLFFDSRSIRLGIICSGFGILPSIFTFKKNERILVGHDSAITCVNLDSLKLEFVRRLSGPFYEFIDSQSTEDVIILYELGILRLRLSGSLIWHTPTEVIENFRITDNGQQIILKLMDKNECEIVNLETGAHSSLSSN